MSRSKTTFKPGESGNPNGRPQGSGRTGKLRELLEPDAPKLVEKAKDLALEGDTTALRLCLERLIPPVKEERITLEGLGPAEGLAAQGQTIIAAAADGQITPGQAASLMQTVASQARVHEVDELEHRIAALEKRLAQ